MTVRPLIWPTLNPDVSIIRVLELIISKYFSLYFCSLSSLWARASSIVLPVIIFSLFSLANVPASPMTCVISPNLVESLAWSSASLEAYSITLAMAVLSRGGNSSVAQKPWITRANLFILSNVKGASSSNSTFILNSFLKSVSTEIRVW